ncbi:MAG: hypothetical protein ACYSUV_01465 [Planctomycetota bacterium]|jgi:hypothetical protein
METLQIGPWIVKYDAEATRRRYEHIDSGLPEKCRCEFCLNFAAARENVYPEEVKKIFVQLGIDYTKEAEVAYTCRMRPGWHSYLGWLHFVGKVEEVLEETIECVPVSKGFRWYFTKAGDVGHEVCSGQPLVQIDFYAEVPWVLEIQEPE